VTDLLPAVAAAGGALLALGWWQRRSFGVELLRRLARGTGEAATPPRPLPWAFWYLQGPLRAAGVSWDPRSTALAVAGGSLGAALLVWLSTGSAWLALAASAMGWYAPVWRLRRLASLRTRRAVAQLDELCAHLIQAAGAGVDLPRALAEEAARLPAPVGPEIRRAVERARAGEPLGEALAGFADRMGLDEARLLAVGLRLAQEEGARPLPVLASVQRGLRSRRDLAGLVEELAARDRRQAAVLLVVPLVLWPAMRLVAPGYTAPLFRTASGQVLLGVDLVWLVFGWRLVARWFRPVAP